MKKLVIIVTVLLGLMLPVSKAYAGNIAQLIMKNEVKKEKAEAIEESILKYSKLYNLEPMLVLAVINIETGSTFNNRLVGTSQDRGLMQIIPSTEKFLARELCMSNYDIFDIDTNIKLGTYFLSTLKEKYKDCALIAYNQGFKEPLNDATLQRHLSNKAKYITKVTNKKTHYESEESKMLIVRQEDIKELKLGMNYDKEHGFERMQKVISRGSFQRDLKEGDKPVSVSTIIRTKTTNEILATEVKCEKSPFFKELAPQVVNLQDPYICLASIRNMFKSRFKLTHIEAMKTSVLQPLGVLNNQSTVDLVFCIYIDDDKKHLMELKDMPSRFYGIPNDLIGNFNAEMWDYRVSDILPFLPIVNREGSEE